jgi:hypothetical protein
MKGNVGNMYYNLFHSLPRIKQLLLKETPPYLTLQHVTNRSEQQSSSRLETLPKQ